jgi:hypothetical protein
MLPLWGEECERVRAIATSWERLIMDDEELEQGALFEIEGPDEDGCVWACSPKGRDVWCRNLGPADAVAERLSQWLGSIDYGESD